MIGLHLSNKTSERIVLSAFCLALCGCIVAAVPNTETQTIATTGLADVFSEIEEHSCPPNIDNPQVNISRNKTTIKWNSVCSNFQVTTQKGSDPLEVFTLEDNANELVIDEALYCTNYAITALSANGSKIGQEIKLPGVPGAINDLVLESTAQLISVSWAPPDDDTCVAGYKLQININDYEDIDLTSDVMNYEYIGLFPCKEFTITVIATTSDDTEGEPTSEQVTTKPSDVLRPVGELKFKESAKDLIVTWTPLAEEEACIKEYKVEVNGEDKGTTPNPTYTISNMENCQTYIVSVVAVPHGSGADSDATEGKHTTGGTVLHPVGELEFKESAKDLIVTWTPLAEEEACIKEYKVEVNGEDKGTTPDPTYTISNMENCKTYKVSVVAVPHDSGADSDATEGEYTAGGTVLHPVGELEFKESAKDLIVTWTPLAEEEACIKEYKVQVNGEDKGTTPDPTYTISNMENCKTYKVSVVAVPHDSGADSDATEGEYTAGGTVLHPVGELEFKESAKDLIVTWTPLAEEEACIKEYKVQVNGEDKGTTPDPTYTISNMENCKTYKVSVVAVPHDSGADSDATEGEYTAGGTVLHPVGELEFKESAKDLIVTWTPLAEEEACIKEYKVEVNGEDKGTTPDPTYTISNMENCKTYKVSVVAVPHDSGADSDATEGEYTAGGTVLHPVGELEFKESAKDLIVTWTPLAEEEACIKEYKVQVNGEDKGTTPDPTYTISNMENCRTYMVSVVAVPHDSGDDSDATEGEYTAGGTAPEAPKLEVDNNNQYLDKIEFTITDTTTKNTCKMTNVKIVCEAKPDTNNVALPWIVLNQEGKFNVTAENAQIFNGELTGLSLFTNYTCIATSFVQDLESPNSVVESANTKPVSPIPTDLQIEGPTSNNSITIKWKSELPEKGTSYLIKVTAIEPIHKIPEGCGRIYNFGPRHTTKLFYEIDDLIPSYQYTISIKSVSWLGVSEIKQMPGTTATAASEAVRELKFEIIGGEISVDAYNQTAKVTWKYPCNTNGVVNIFRIAIVETSKETSSTQEKVQEITISDTIAEIYHSSIPLEPFSNYEIKINTISDLEGHTERITFESPEGYAEEPESLEITEIDEIKFTISWQPPARANGELVGYLIQIYEQPAFVVQKDCRIHNDYYEEFVEKNIQKFDYLKSKPYYKYEIRVAAQTKGDRYGKAASIERTTKGSGAPEKVRIFEVQEKSSHTSENFENTMRALILPPCNIAGKFKAYAIEFIGTRTDFEDHEGTYEILDESGIDNGGHKIKAEHKYTIHCKVLTETGVSEIVTTELEGKTGSGVPQVVPGHVIEPPNEESVISFSPSSFDNANGDLLYFAILLSANYNFDYYYGYWDGETWPDVGHYYNGLGSVIEPYQITPEGWPSNFTERARDDSLTYPIGQDSCEQVTVLCNGPLRSDTKYTVTVRGFTNGGYRDIRTNFDTQNLSKSISLGVILGIIFGVVFTGLIFLGSYMVYRKRIFRSNKDMKRTMEINRMHAGNDGFVLTPGCYNDDEDEQEDVMDFTSLQRAGERAKGPTTVAESIENKKRNRYVNILPFDSTRVILHEGVDSDYINASFIKGYSSHIEYIAAQGPLESTVEDFWRMVAQEKVTTILMLTQLREQNREKCFKYFPSNNETMRCNGMSLYCSEENVCKTYIQRKLVLDIGQDRFNIQHFQYTDWPDFNVPEGTENMIKFVKKVRKLKNQIGGVILVHCSAGVGRTGTFISIDILLQAIDEGQEWNTYQTVLDLRSQRVNMVQNEKQYLYIGTCVEDYVKNKNQSVYNIEIDEPIYANVINKHHLLNTYSVD